MSIEIIKTEGHFGNPITILHAQIKGRNCRRFIELLKPKLGEHDLKRLKSESCEKAMAVAEEFF